MYKNLYVTHKKYMSMVIPVVKSSGYHLLTQLKLPKLIHKALFKNQLAIIMYHAVSRTLLEVNDPCFLDYDLFHKQITYLKRNFEILPLSSAIEKCKNKRIKYPTVAITFDDGFQNNYDVAFPILREAGVPATIFLVTSVVDTEDTIWFCRLNWALANTRKLSLDWANCQFNLKGVRQKAMAAVTLQALLKMHSHSRLMTELRQIIIDLGVNPDNPFHAGSPYRMLNCQAVKEMIDSGLIEFGAHTNSHAILSLLSSQERYDQIKCSVESVQKLTRRPCELFAYPNGRIQDYNDETIAILRKCGIRAAVTTIEGPNDSKTPDMELRRYNIGSNQKMVDFQMKVHHTVACLKSIINL